MIVQSFFSHSKLFGDKYLSSKCCLFLVLNFRIMSHPVSRKKHFSPFHKQDKKVFVFPNTPKNFIKSMPRDMRTTLSLDSFKIKFSRHDFKRCTEDITQRGCYDETTNHVSDFDEPRAQNVQLELTAMAICYLENISSSFQNPSHGMNKCMGHDKRKHGKLALDVGCGRGIAMDPLVKRGYTCIGVDLDLHSLSKFKNYKNSVSWINSPSTRPTKEMNVNTPPADIVRWDLRHGLPFRENMCDAILSISFLQWLFHGNTDHQLDLFFSSLYKVLCTDGAAVIQFYPRSQKQLSNAVAHAMVYFKGALIGDYPHLNRGRKFFLLLKKA